MAWSNLMDSRTRDWRTWSSRFGRVPLGSLDLGVFAGVFLFRWLTVEFTNDHFVHLSRARQILLGDVPIRDFFEQLFLQTYLSSAFQLVFGYNLFGEALLTISLVAFGTMLVFHLSARLSGSRWLATGAALLTVLAYPRLYSYPKVFLYVAAIGLAWLYAQRGTRVHVSLMAALTAVAFLLRHDHGVYIAVMLVCCLGLRDWAARCSGAGWACMRASPLACCCPSRSSSRRRPGWCRTSPGPHRRLDRLPRPCRPS